jgi:hypothetical protein
MLSPPRDRSWGKTEPREGVLYLEGRPVGRVSLVGRDGPWCFGHFTPDQEFWAFDRYFRVWSELLHAGSDGQPLSDGVREKLSALEKSIDQLRATIHLTDADERHEITELNIDGEMIEWKHD